MGLLHIGIFCQNWFDVFVFLDPETPFSTNDLEVILNVFWNFVIFISYHIKIYQWLIISSYIFVSITMKYFFKILHKWYIQTKSIWFYFISSWISLSSSLRTLRLCFYSKYFVFFTSKASLFFTISELLISFIHFLKSPKVNSFDIIFVCLLSF